MTNITIEFNKLSEEQLRHLYKAENQLKVAGVTFDVGIDHETKTRIWELDWSLKGAKVVIKRKKVKNN